MSHPPSSELFIFPLAEFDGADEEPLGVDLGPSELALYMADWGADDFFVGRRDSASGSSEFSRAQLFGQQGLRIVESNSESDTDEQIVAIGNSPLGYDADLPFCWECLHVEEGVSDPTEDLEWEDVADRGEEREIFCLTPFPDDNDDSVANPNPDAEESGVSEMNVDWEVLLSVNDNYSESFFVEDQEGFTYASEYEVLFGQFGDHGGSEYMRCRPAARSVVRNLPSIYLTADDVAKGNIHCAVCKDEISLSEELKELPCLHFYHECCIVPWLEIRNTCPICRFELPSSDTVGETIAESDEAQARYVFDILQGS